MAIKFFATRAPARRDLLDIYGRCAAWRLSSATHGAPGCDLQILGNS